MFYNVCVMCVSNVLIIIHKVATVKQMRQRHLLSTHALRA